MVLDCRESQVSVQFGGVPSSSDRSIPPGLASVPLLLRVCSHRHRVVPPGHPIPFHRGGEGRRTLGAEELARDVEGLAADNNDLLAAQQLLGDDGGQAAEEVALAIDDDLWEGEHVSRCAQGGWLGALARGIAAWPGDVPKLLSWWCALRPARCDCRGGGRAAAAARRISHRSAPRLGRGLGHHHHRRRRRRLQYSRALSPRGGRGGQLTTCSKEDIFPVGYVDWGTEKKGSKRNSARSAHFREWEIC